MSNPTPVTQPSSVYTVAEANAGLDFSTAPSLPVAVAISGGGTLSFVDSSGGTTSAATLAADRPYPWTIREVTACTGSGQVQFFFDLTALERVEAWTPADIVALQADVSTLQGDVTTLQGDVSTLQTDVAAVEASAAGLAIYQQGGVASGNTYITLRAALNAVKSRGGGEVLVDASGAQPVTDGAAYNFADVSLGLTYWSGGGFTLDIADATTFTGLERLVSIFINNKSAAPVITIGNGEALELHLTEVSGISTDASGSAPFFKVLSGGTLLLYLNDYCTLNGNGVHAVVDADAGSSVSIGMSPASTIASNTLTGAGSINVQRGLGAVVWATVDATQTGASALTLDPP